jgi:hypothetical protein
VSLVDAQEHQGFAFVPGALTPDQFAELLVLTAPADRSTARNLLRELRLAPALAPLGVDAVAADALGRQAVPIEALYFDKTAAASCWRRAR